MIYIAVASEEAEPWRGSGHEAMCQQGREARKRINLGVPHQLAKRTSISKDIVPEGSGLWDLILVEEKNETFLIRVWKPLRIRPILKMLRRILKRKAKIGQYPLGLTLCYYNLLDKTLKFKNPETKYVHVECKKRRFQETLLGKRFDYQTIFWLL